MSDLNKNVIPEIEGNYIRIPKELFSTAFDGLTLSKVYIAAVIYSLTGRQETNGDPALCRWGYNKFESALNVAHSTVAAAMKVLTEQSIVERKQKRGTYDFGRNAVQGRYYLRAELWLFTTKFKIRGEAEPRYLTRSEIAVFSLILTRCANAKRKSKSFEASISNIADELHLSKRTVSGALRTLFRADLIYRPAEEKGKNAYQKSVYHVNDDLLRRKRKEQKKAVRAELTPAEKAIEAADARAERERYYAARRAKAMAAAEKNRARAEKDEEYRETERDLSGAERQAARAEALEGGRGLAALQVRIRQLRARKAAILRRLGLTDKDLTPRWHCECCEDTGFRPDGRACGCYERR